MKGGKKNITANRWEVEHRTLEKCLNKIPVSKKTQKEDTTGQHKGNDNHIESK